MLLLPTFNAQLRPCPVGTAAFTPHAQGQFCSQCQRVVQDFSQSQNPVADLAAARAAAPDGRVCGSFAVAQVQRPRLPQRLRWFVVALVLVIGQGLTAREALAQVRKSHSSKLVYKRPPGPMPMQIITEETYGDVDVLLPKPMATRARPHLTMPEQKAVIEPPESPQDSVKKMSNRQIARILGREKQIISPMPVFLGGGAAKVRDYIQQQIIWPQKDGKRILVEGRIFVNFAVGTDGKAYDAIIVKSLHPLLDAEVLRVVRQLPAFEPVQLFGQPAEASLTIPIDFKLE